MAKHDSTFSNPTLLRVNLLSGMAVLGFVDQEVVQEKFDKEGQKWG